MKGNFKDFRAFADEVVRAEQSKQDFVVPTSQMRMIEDKALAFGGNTFEVNDHAHGQLAARVGIPKDYYDKMLAVPGLRTQNVNAWFDQRQEKRMVRTLDNRVRAFVSDGFKTWDNFLVLNALMPVVKSYSSDVQIVSSGLTDARMYLQMVFPKLQGEVRKGDVVQYGATITNSEIGMSNVDIETLIWTLWCTNGAVGQSILKKRHAGKRLDADDGDFRIYQRDTWEAEMKAFELRVRDLFTSAMTEVKFEEQLMKLRKAAGMEVVNPMAVIENVTTRFGFPESSRDELLGLMIKPENGPTQWGLAQAVTFYAQRFDLDRQYAMERAGAEIVDLKPSEWEVLNEAAA